MKWLEVELQVSGELAEPVAELLARYAHGGAVLSSAEPDDPTHPVIVSAYLPTDDQLDTARQQIAAGLWHLSQIQSLPEASYRWIEDEDWSKAWRRHYRPLAVGRRLLVQPAWLKPHRQGRLAILMDPGMAFGTGTHPSTILALVLLEEAVVAGCHVVDLGCGSGILSIAALLLGAAEATALDIDPAATRATLSNAQANKVDDRLGIVEGGLPTLKGLLDQGLQADLIVANILAPALETMLEQGLAECLPAGGGLILSGILDEQSDGVRQAAARAGLQVTDERAEGDWRAILARKAAL